MSKKHAKRGSRPIVVGHLEKISSEWKLLTPKINLRKYIYPRHKAGTCLATCFSFLGDTSDNISGNDIQSKLWMIAQKQL
jgi:hypothetical protein